MVEAKILVPLQFGGTGCTGILRLWTDTDLAKHGFHEDGSFPWPPAFPLVPGDRGFLSTAKLAYRIALNRYGLPAGLAINWDLTPTEGGQFQGFQGGSAGAAFLLAFMRMRIGEFDSRSARRNSKLEDAIETVKLEWVAASASIDGDGTFGPVHGPTLIEKLRALIVERPLSGVRLAVISNAQQIPPQQDGQFTFLPVRKMSELFEFSDRGLRDSIHVIRAKDAVGCYEKLFRLQSQQVLL